MDAAVEIAEIVHQILDAHAIGLLQFILEYLHCTGIGDAMSQWCFLGTCTGEVLVYLLPDDRHDVRHTTHVRLGHHAGHIKVSPIMVVADESRLVVGHFQILHLFKLARQSFQHLALALAHLDLLEVLEERRVDGEKVHIVIEVGVHVGEVLGELAEMLADDGFLLLSLTEQTLLHYKLHVLLGDGYLTVAVVDAPQHICRKLELRCVVDQLLHTEYHAELGMVALLPECLKHLQVAVQTVVGGAAFQVGQHLIDDNHQSLVREPLLEVSHHSVEFVAMAIRSLIVQNGIVDAPFLQSQVYLIAYDAPKFIIATQLEAYHLVFACNVAEHRPCAVVLHKRKKLCVLGNQ